MFYAVTIYGGPLRHKGIEFAGGSDVVPRFQLSLGGRLTPRLNYISNIQCNGNSACLTQFHSHEGTTTSFRNLESLSGMRFCRVAGPTSRNKRYSSHCARAPRWRPAELQRRAHLGKLWFCAVLTLRRSLIHRLLFLSEMCALLTFQRNVLIPEAIGDCWVLSRKCACEAERTACSVARRTVVSA